jgi:hypothetical protein
MAMLLILAVKDAIPSFKKDSEVITFGSSKLFLELTDFPSSNRLTCLKFN